MGRLIDAEEFKNHIKERFSFEFCAGGTMKIYDQEKKIGYAVHIAPIELGF